MPRYSYKREAILNCLRSTKSHPSAEWVFAQLKPQIPDLSLGTVYRNLSQFKEQGVIMSVGVVNGLERFDANTMPHVHFVCEHCSSVIDLDNLDLPHEMLEMVQTETCVQISTCEINLRGTCKNCQVSGKNQELKN